MITQPFLSLTEESLTANIIQVGIKPFYTKSGEVGWPNIFQDCGLSKKVPPWLPQEKKVSMTGNNPLLEK